MRTVLLSCFVASAMLAGCQNASASETRGSAAAKAPTGSVRVEVGSEGFRPSLVVVGPERRIVFHRTVEATCATAVVFPSLGIQKELPLKTDVVVDVPPSVHGEIAFQCGMGMYRGMAVATERAQ